MASRGKFSLTNPDNVDMTLTITMPIKEWKLIKQRLQPTATNADWYLNDTIMQMIEKAEKEFNFYEEIIPASAEGASPANKTEG